MIATRSWKRVGALILGIVSHGFCTEHGIFMTIVAGKDSEKNLRVNEEVLNLTVVGYRLEDSLIRKNLGKWFPNAKRVSIEKVPPSEIFSGGDSTGEVAPCTKVQTLVICMSCNGSPRMLEHIKLLFPGATNLTFGSDGTMPIHELKDAETCQKNKLAMEGVTRLRLESGSTTKAGILFENLRLFPKVGELSLLGDIRESATEEIQKTNLVLSHVKKLYMHEFFMDEGCLSRLPTMFPSVEKLSIKGSALEKMMTREVEEDVDQFFFEKLSRLEIYFEMRCPSNAVSFGERMKEVFPFLSQIKFSVFSKNGTLLRPKDVFPVEKVTSVEVRGLLRCLPDFLEEMFPKLDSFTVAECSNLEQLSRGKSFFHRQLRHLDISDNKRLEKILEGMDGPQSGSDGVAVGGLDLPCLERLNISRSFECKIPGWFLQGCPRIKSLTVSVDPERYEHDLKGSWWEFLRPLSKLEEVRVEIIRSEATFNWSGYKLQENSGFSGNGLQDIVEGLSRDLIEARRSFKLHASIHFYKYNRFGGEYIVSIGPPEKEYS